MAPNKNKKQSNVTQRNQQAKPAVENPVPQKQQNAKKNEKKKDKRNKGPSFNIFRLDLLFRNPDMKPFKLHWYDILALILITALSLLTHFLHFGHPDKVVFDEVYFGNFTNYYTKGSYFFDIHPPLGKLLLYLGSVLSGYEADLTFQNINQVYPNDHYKKLRFWPSLTGSLISPVVYLTLRMCDATFVWSTVGAILPAFDNMLLVESRFVLIDAYLWFFAALSSLIIACAIRIRNHNILFAVLTGLSVGATLSVKFTGAGVSIAAVHAFFMHYNFFDAFKMSFYAAISGFFMLIGSFYVHFVLLPNPGMGCAYTRQICKKMEKHELSPLVATFDLIRTMLSSNFAINEEHPYSSKWWQWPLQLGKGNWMWVNEKEELWSVGTTVIWYFSFLSLILVIIRLPKDKNVLHNLWILITYFISYLPFALIKRVMWNYHYAIPLIYSLEIATVAWSGIPNAHVRYSLPLILLIAAALNYMVLIPVTNGLPIDSNDYYNKFFFKAWHY